MKHSHLVIAVAVAVAVVAAAACTRGMDVRTAVTSAAGPPIAGAAVLTDCPQLFKGSGESLLGQTDRDGVLHHREHPWGRWIHDRCALLIEKPGFVSRRIPVAEVCDDYDLNHCVLVDVDVDLTPAGGAR